MNFETLLNEDALKQTGRTTAMCREAILQSARGRRVYIYATRVSKYPIERKIEELVKANSLDPVVSERISVSYVPHEFDWRRMRVPGANKNCVFLLDHALMLEYLSDYNTLLQELARANNGYTATS